MQVPILDRQFSKCILVIQYILQTSNDAFGTSFMCKFHFCYQSKLLILLYRCFKISNPPNPVSPLHIALLPYSLITSTCQPLKLKCQKHKTIIRKESYIIITTTIHVGSQLGIVCCFDLNLDIPFCLQPFHKTTNYYPLPCNKISMLIYASIKAKVLELQRSSKLWKQILDRKCKASIELH